MALDVLKQYPAALKIVFRSNQMELQVVASAEEKSQIHKIKDSNKRLVLNRTSSLYLRDQLALSRLRYYCLSGRNLGLLAKAICRLLMPRANFCLSVF